MPHNASIAFHFYLYLLSKIEEYSSTTINVSNFAIFTFFFFFFLPNCETKYNMNYKHFVPAKFVPAKCRTFLMKNNSSRKNSG